MGLARNIRQFLFGIILVHSAFYLEADDCSFCEVSDECCQNISQNNWIPRPFSSYSAREMTMFQDLDFEDSWASMLGVSVEYMQSFGNSEARLGSLPFWSGSNKMTIGNNNGKSDLDGYQFGLGEIVQEGSITLTPHVKQAGAEFLWYVVQSPHDRGLFFQCKVPVGAMIVDYDVCEDFAVADGSVDGAWNLYPSTEVRFSGVQEALTGGFPSKEPDYKYGRLFPGKNSSAHFSDVEFVAGYHFLASENGYMGAGFKVSCPTGTVPDAKFILEPIFGRAGHWGLGGELRGSYKLWECDDLNVYVHARAELLHLTSGRRPTWRSFDLKKNGPGSKYMLLQMYVVNDAVGRVPCYVEPAINITTLPVCSSFPMEGSIAVMIDANKDNWFLGLTGEFWGRSCEKLGIDTTYALVNGEQNLNDYAVLGRQIGTDDRFNRPFTLALCEPCAQINKSEDRVLAQGTPPGPPPASNAASAPDPATYDTTKIKDGRLAENRISAKYEDALDIAGARANRVYTGRLVANIGYTWSDHMHAPHLSLFTGVEIADSESKMINSWSVGVQGSLKF